MGNLMARLALTLLKLAFAALVLALGWMILSPQTTAAWPLAGAVGALSNRLSAIGASGPEPWGVVTLLLGVACALAALPMSVKAKSKKRASATPALMPVLDMGSAAADPFPTVEAAPAKPVATRALDTTPTEPPLPVLDPNATAAPPVEVEALAADGETETLAETSHTDEPVQAEHAPIEEAAEELQPHPVLEALAATGPAHAETPGEEVEAEPDYLFFEQEVADARRAVEVKGDGASRSRLADLLKKQGDIAEAEGRLGEAIEAYEESAGLRRVVLASDEANGREQRWLWTTLDSLAECREDRGHRSRAAALFRESIEAGARAVALVPEENGYVAELEETRGRLAALEAQLVI